MAFNFENYVSPIANAPSTGIPASGTLNSSSPLNKGFFCDRIGLCIGTGTPDVLYTRIVYFLTWGMGIVAVLVLIYGGMLYITAGAEAEKAEKGKKVIIGSVIGIIIIMVSYTVYNTAIGALKQSGTSGPLTEEQMREQLNKPPEQQVY